jgi:hypothetical protein
MLEGVIPGHEVGMVASKVAELACAQRAEYEAHVAEAGAAGHAVGSPGLESCEDVISAIPAIAPHLADRRILDIVGGLFGPAHRITSTGGSVTHPGTARGRWHADWPFNQRLGSHLPVPYPDAVLHLTAIFMLSDFSAETGATLIVPGSHRCPSNPSWDGTDHPADAPHPAETAVTGSPGSVLLFDSRLWHCRGANRSDEPRITLLCRYSPWWLNLEVRRAGSPDHEAVVEAGGRENSVPLLERTAFEALPDDVKPLLRHWVKA